MVSVSMSIHKRLRAFSSVATLTASLASSFAVAGSMTHTSLKNGIVAFDSASSKWV